jgi:hypothetical protein
VYSANARDAVLIREPAEEMAGHGRPAWYGACVRRAPVRSGSAPARGLNRTRSEKGPMNSYLVTSGAIRRSRGVALAARDPCRPGSRSRSAPVLAVVVTTITAALALLLFVSTEYGAQIFPSLWASRLPARPLRELSRLCCSVAVGLVDERLGPNGWCCTPPAGQSVRISWRWLRAGARWPGR